MAPASLTHIATRNTSESKNWLVRHVLNAERHIMPTTTIVLAIFVAVNSLFTAWNSAKIYMHYRGKTHANQYTQTFIGDDVPLVDPMLHSLGSVALNLQETSHFQYNISTPTIDAEWATLTAYPGGTGRMIRGHNNRLFLSTFYHQLHCIGELRKGLLNRNHSSATPHHINHCLQYLRQTLLCTAADSVERGDFLGQQFGSDRVGSDLVCKDWEKAYEVMTSEWTAFRSGGHP